MKLRLLFLLSILCLLPATSHAQTAGGVKSINGVPGPFTFGSGATCVGTLCTFSGGGGSLPTSNALGDQLFATAASSTTYTARTLNKVPVELYGATAYTTIGAAEAGPDDTADFQAAVTGTFAGVATCQAGLWYHVEGPLNFASYKGLIGTSNQTYSAQCHLVSNSATTHILSAVGVSGTPVIGVTLANLDINRSTAGTGTSAGVYASFTGGMIVTNTRSNDSIYDFYRHASPGFGIGYWSYNQAAWSLGETSGTYYGVYDDSADGNAENSIILTHSGTTCSGLSGSAIGYGQILIGEAVNDNDTWDFNTANCQYGQVVDYTGSGGTIATNDIHFYGSTLDGSKISCLKISNTSQATDGFVEVNGGHCDTVASTGSLIDIESSYGVKIAGMSISQTTGGTPALHFILANSSTNVVLANNILTNFSSTTGGSSEVELNGTSHSVLSGNSIHAYTANAGNLIWLTGNSTYNSITGNTLTGYSTAGNGIGIDAGSNNNTYSGNAIDTTHITSGIAIADAGTGGGQLSPQGVAYGFTNTSAAAHVGIGTYYAPNATYGSTCLIYDIYGNNSTNNAVQKLFSCLGSGSTTNFYGEHLFGDTAAFNWAIFSNYSTVLGESTPVAGPANGIAVGTTGQCQISGTGAVTCPSFNGTLLLTGATGTITGTALTATCDSGTATVTGAVVGHPVEVSSTTGADVGGAFYLRGSVTSTNTVTVYVCGTGTPSSLAYNVVVF